VTSRNGRPRRCACGRSFKLRRSDARYCSSACRQAAHRARAKEDDLPREIEDARRRYWRLVDELARSRGVDAVTSQSQLIDKDGNVHMHGELVGKTKPHRPGWAAWGLEAAGPPFRPPPRAPS
jgi:hypothetical protein